MNTRRRLRPRNPERMAEREARQFGEQAERCRRSRCAVPGCRWKKRCDPHHHPTRAAGGLDKDTLPLCPDHHNEVHRIGARTFEERYGLVLREETRKMRRRAPLPHQTDEAERAAVEALAGAYRRQEER